VLDTPLLPGSVDDRPHSPEIRDRDIRRVVLVLGLWALAVLACRVIAESIMRRDGFAALRLGAAPLVGRQEAAVGVRLAVPVVVGATLVMVLPRFAVRLRWRPLLLVVVLAAVSWVAAVNFTRPDGLTRPLERPGDEYLVDVPSIDSPRDFLTTYPDRIDDYSVHTRSHPPGFVLLLWGLDALGFGGAGWAAALVVGAGASGLAAVLIGVREVAGEQVARSAAPFLVLAPAALWIGSTADALYAAVGAAGLALVLVASGRPGAAGRGTALAGGVALGACLLFSYGLWLLGLVAIPTIARRRRWDLVPIAVAGALSVVTLFWLAGFDYLAGFAATRREVAESVQSTRPLALFVVLNLAVLGIACGPAVLAGLARLRDRATWSIVGGALLAVAIADASGLSKGEVERIWLPFTVWMIVAGSAHRPPARAWLVVQVVFALTIQTLVRTGW
jgi:hypothetical protein